MLGGQHDAHQPWASHGSPRHFGWPCNTFQHARVHTISTIGSARRGNSCLGNPPAPSRLSDRPRPHVKNCKEEARGGQPDFTKISEDLTHKAGSSGVYGGCP